MQYHNFIVKLVIAKEGDEQQVECEIGGGDQEEHIPEKDTFKAGSHIVECEPILFYI